MLFSGNIAAGGDGLFFLIVAIFVIIAQIKKAMQKGQPPGQRPASPSFPAEPEDELREFLKKLSEGQTETRPSAPTPGQRAAQAQAREPLPPPLPRHRTQPPMSSSRTRHAAARDTVRAAQTARESVRHETTASRDAANRRATQNVRMAEPAFVRPHAVRPQLIEQTTTEPDGLNKLTYLAGGLGGRAALRRAIILREILGPPLAMRKMASHAFIG